MLFNVFYRTDVRLYINATWSISKKKCENDSDRTVCMQHAETKKNRLQSNQSRYKYAFYGINKCFVSENSHPHSAQHTMPSLCVLVCCCCFRDFDWGSLSTSSTKICDWISFKFYVQPSQAFGHFTFHTFSMVKFWENTRHTMEYQNIMFCHRWWCWSTNSQ